MAKVKIIKLDDNLVEAIAFMIEHPDQDIYISENIEQFLTDGEYDDNSIRLAKEWDAMASEVWGFLNRLIKYGKS